MVHVNINLKVQTRATKNRILSAALESYLASPIILMDLSRNQTHNCPYPSPQLLNHTDALYKI